MSVQVSRLPYSFRCLWQHPEVILSIKHIDAVINWYLLFELRKWFCISFIILTANAYVRISIEWLLNICVSRPSFWVRKNHWQSNCELRKNIEQIENPWRVRINKNKLRSFSIRKEFGSKILQYFLCGVMLFVSVCVPPIDLSMRTIHRIEHTVCVCVYSMKQTYWQSTQLFCHRVQQPRQQRHQQATYKVSESWNRLVGYDIKNYQR